MLYPQGTLLGIPQQVMLAAMADGWVVRNDCIWSKASPMPESIKGVRWQQAQCACIPVRHDALVDERPALGGNHRNGSNVGARTWRHTPAPACTQCGGTGWRQGLMLRRGSWRHTRSHEVVLMLTKGMGYWADGEAVQERATSHERFHGAYATGKREQARNGREDPSNVTATRNPRSVLTPQAAQCNLEHYATFPSGLIAPLIQASVPPQCCAACGAGYAPVSDHTDTSRPTCACPRTCPPVPGMVLDPFCGTGTTVAVARALGRQGIGLDLSFGYLQQEARTRLGWRALAAWEGRASRLPEPGHADLPLFAPSLLGDM